MSNLHLLPASLKNIVHGKEVNLNIDIYSIRIVWRTVPSIDGLKVSNIATVRDTETKEIIMPYKSKGYRIISFRGKRYKIARLVGLAFVPNPENKKFINHKNGVKDFDFPINLEWATNSENTSHAINELGYVNNFGKLGVDVILGEAVVFNARSVQEAARFVNGKSTHVSQVCKGKRNHHMGHIFRYSA